MLPAKHLDGPEMEAALLKAAADHGWPFNTCGMKPGDMLLVDSGARKMVENHLPEYGPRLLSPDQFNPEEVEQGARVFVLAQEGECAIVRRLQASHPALTVISVCYGNLLQVRDLKQLFQGLDLTVLAASQVCGSEYLSALLEANKVAQVVQALDDVTTLWAHYASDFSISRRLIAILTQAKQSQPKLPIILSADLDQIEMLQLFGLFSFETMKRFTDWLGIGCIYMTRRNKAMQAAEILCLENSGARGIKEATDVAGLRPPAEAPAVAQVLPIVLELVSQECRFESFMGNLAVTRAITFEDLEANPVAVLSMLVLFLGLGTLRKANVINPTPYSLQVAWQQEFQAAFRENAEAFIGVSKNGVGSYASTMSLR